MADVIERYLRQAFPLEAIPPGPLRDNWIAWNRRNPHFYPLFERFALEAIESGARKSGAWLIVQRIRWESKIVTRGDDYKVNNDFIAYFARYFAACHPEHAGFFTIKQMTRC